MEIIYTVKTLYGLRGLLGKEILPQDAIRFLYTGSIGVLGSQAGCFPGSERN
ncbi:MAG: hypothetical protein LLG09_01480 [Negativicutes bacterium]|nr:hypothetical protein [Negativicutes bacterium]